MKSILIVFMILPTLLIDCNADYTNNRPKDFLTYKNNTYNIDFNYPGGADLRIDSIAPDIQLIKFVSGGEYFYIYMGIVEDDVDYKKLPNYVSTLLKVGNLISSEKKYTSHTLLYDKNSNGYYSKILIIGREENFYIIASYNKKQDFRLFDNLTSSVVITKSMNFMTVVKIIAFSSLSIHLTILGLIALIAPPLYSLGEIKSRSFKSIGLYVSIIIFAAVIYGFYFIAKELYPYLNPFSLSGVYYIVVELTPSIFNIAGEIISEAMAEIIRFGFWPGGNTGVVLTTIVFLILNVVEMKYAKDIKNWLVEVYRDAIKRK